EAGFPETQSVLRKIELLGGFRNGAEGVRRFLQTTVSPRTPDEPSVARPVICASVSPTKPGTFQARCLGWKTLLSSADHRLVNLGLQHIGGFEHKNLPGQDRHFLAGLGIAPDALVL